MARDLFVENLLTTQYRNMSPSWANVVQILFINATLPTIPAMQAFFEIAVKGTLTIPGSALDTATGPRRSRSERAKSASVVLPLGPYCSNG